MVALRSQGNWRWEGPLGTPLGLVPHRWQPTRLRRPWDSPGENTGVGCHFLLQCMKVKSESEVQSCPTLCDHIDSSPPGSSVPGILQARILEWVAIPFSRESSNLGFEPSLLHCRQILYHLSHQIFGKIIIIVNNKLLVSTYILILAMISLYMVSCLG